MGNMDWVDMARDRDGRWAIVNAIMNLLITYNVVNFLTS